MKTSADETANLPAKTLFTPRWTILGWLLVALLIVTNLPIFVCLPLTDDAQYYDLQLRIVLRGGVLYRDCREPNFPGVHWVHRLVRTVGGWSTEAIRLFDFLYYSVTIALIYRWVRDRKLGSTMAIGTSLVLLFFYLSISEWNHCQRDVWLLLPALTALHLRTRQSERILSATTSKQILGWSFLEGTAWGIGVWLKPHIVIPAAMVWLASVLLTKRWRQCLIDVLGLIVGGGLMGAIGVAWLIASGSWPYFWETMTKWNPEYLRAGLRFWEVQRLSGLWLFFPYAICHAIALPTAFGRIIESGLGNENTNAAAPESCDSKVSHRNAATFLAAIYLGWTAQVFFLQHLFNYVYGPTIILAIAYLVTESAKFPSRAFKVACVIALIAAMFLSPQENRDDGSPTLTISPALNLRRLSLWPSCVANGSTAEIRDQLAFEIKPQWRDVEKVAEFLRAQQLRDRELLCYSVDLLELYKKLDVRPPSRIVYVEQIPIFFPHRSEMLRVELEQSPMRFIAVDLAACGFNPREARKIDEASPLAPPGLARGEPGDFPWSLPIVFRAGTIVVYQRTGTIQRFPYPAPKNEELASQNASRGR